MTVTCSVGVMTKSKKNFSLTCVSVYFLILLRTINSHHAGCRDAVFAQPKAAWMNQPHINNMYVK